MPSFPIFAFTSLVALSALPAPSASGPEPAEIGYFALLQEDVPELECAAEAGAFAEVADLAHVYREDGDLFTGALFDLREQLLDCLATSDNDAQPGDIHGTPAGRPRSI